MSKPYDQLSKDEQIAFDKEQERRWEARELLRSGESPEDECGYLHTPERQKLRRDLVLALIGARIFLDEKCEDFAFIVPNLEHLILTGKAKPV